MKNKRIFNRLISVLDDKKILYAVTIILSSSFMLIFNFFAAYGLKNGIDAALSMKINKVTRSFAVMALGIALIVFISPLAKYIYQKLYISAVGNFKKMLYDHTQHLPIDYYEKHKNGEFVSKFNNDITEVKTFYGDRMANLIFSIISGIGSAVLMFMLNIKLSLIAIITGILYVLIDKALSKKIKEINTSIQESNAGSTEEFSNIINGFSTIKSFNLENTMKKDYGVLNKKIYKRSMKLVIWKSLFSGISNIMGTVSFMGVMFLGCFMIYKNETTMGTMLGVVQLQNGLMTMFQTLGDYVIDVQKSYASAERVYEIMDSQDEESIHIKSSDKVINSGSSFIDFNNVGFSYEGRDFALKDINISAERGEKIALVGSSGSGKSTIFKLLMRLYNASSGSIFIDGRNINKYTLDELREKIACVEQESCIFNGTIEENIGLGKAFADRSEIINAAKLAQADEFINEFKDGYDTVIGEEGVNLSGGQKQRIAIARAFLKDAPILLLDEATSALDSDSETKVQEALDTLMKGRTTIAIAHRLSTIINSDRIYVVGDGKIIEKGKHSELMDEEGEYRKLYNIQFSGM